MEIIDRFIAWYFVPPPCPPLNAGWVGKVAGVESAFVDFGRLCYFEGAKDGAMAGAVAVLLILAVVFVSRAKGVAGAVDSVS